MTEISKLTKGDKDETVGLKRNLGLMAAINVIISVMIGSGIFISPTAALKYSGSIGMCLLIWTLCGVVSLLGKLLIRDCYRSQQQLSRFLLDYFMNETHKCGFDDDKISVHVRW